MLKIIFYYIKRNLGHSRIIFSLAKGIKLYFNRKSSLIIFQSGKKDNFLPFKKCSSFYNLSLATNNITYQATLKKRISLLMNTVKKFNPGIFITELYPFGKDNFSQEIPYVLGYLRKKSQIKIISSISYLMWSKDALSLLRKFYDYIFCHFPENYLQTYFISSEASKEGKALFKDILKYFKGRIYFTDFILDKEALLTTLPAHKNSILGRNKKFILVSIGGGTENDKQLVILNSLLAAEKLKEHFFLIIAGTLMKQYTYDKLQKIAQRIPHVKLIRHTQNFQYYLNHCDLSINMAGYNTVVGTLWLKKKSIIIPYKTEEQRVLADFMKRTYNLPVIFQEELTPDRLLAYISKELRNGKMVSIKKENFEGIKNTNKLLKNIAKGRKYLC